MPRFARDIVPGMPHHITHRGNRRDDVFFSVERLLVNLLDDKDIHTKSAGANGDKHVYKTHRINVSTQSMLFQQATVFLMNRVSQ